MDDDIKALIAVQKRRLKRLKRADSICFCISLIEHLEHLLKNRQILRMMKTKNISIKFNVKS